MTAKFSSQLLTVPENKTDVFSLVSFFSSLYFLLPCDLILVEIVTDRTFQSYTAGYGVLYKLYTQSSGVHTVR